MKDTGEEIQMLLMSEWKWIMLIRSNTRLTEFPSGKKIKEVLPIVCFIDSYSSNNRGKIINLQSPRALHLFYWKIKLAQNK